MVQMHGTFQVLFEQFPQPMWVHDPVTLSFLLVNDAATQVYGWTREEFLRMKLTDIRPEGELSRPLQHQAVGASGYRDAGVCRHLTKDGRDLDVRVGAWNYLMDGRPVVLATAADVTEELRREAALKDSEALFRRLVESLPLNIYLIQEGRFIYANPEFCATLGYSLEEILAAPSMLDMVVREDRRLVMETYRQRSSGGGEVEPYRFSALRKDGSTVPVEVRASLMSFHGRSTLLGIATNLRGRFETENALRLGLELATMLAEASRSFIALEDEASLRAELVALSERLAPTLSWKIEDLEETPRPEAGEVDTVRLEPTLLRELLPTAQADPDATQRIRVAPAPFPHAPEPGEGRSPRTGSAATIRFSIDLAFTLVGRTRPERAEEPLNPTRLQAVEGLAAAARMGLQRIRSQRNLQEQELRLRNLIDQNLAGIFRLEPSGSFIEINDAMARLFGLESGLPLKGRPAEVLFGARIWANLLGQLREEPHGRLADFEIGLRRRDGKAFWALLNLTLSEGEGGPVIQGSILDITHRHITEVWDRGQAEFLELVAQNQPLEMALAHLVRMLEAQAAADGHGAVLLVRGNRLRPSVAPGLPEGLQEAVGALSLEGKERFLEADPALDEAWAPYRGLAASYGYKAFASAPVLAATGEALGLLVLHFQEEESAADYPKELLQPAGRLAGMALDHAALTERLAHQAQYDALTDLPNRTLFLDRLNQGIHHAARHGKQLAVLLLDLDGFKRVNDSLGHAAGDEILKQVSKRFSAVVRKADTLARLGGDEFLVLVTSLQDPRGALRLAHLMIEAMKAPFRIGGHELHLSTSVGLSFFPADAEDGETLLSHADAAMYRAKALGRNNLQCFTPALNAELEARMGLEGKLRQALRAKEFRLHYQPQLSADGRLIGFEALVRWPHAELGMVSPAKFIPLAEECGLIQELGTWVLDEACRQMAEWHRRGYRSLRVAVNVSPLQFERGDWKETVEQALNMTGLDPAGLELEMTEGLVMGPDSVQRLAELREMGLALAIDDFGTGYSSMSYLQHLPVQTLKIDQSFVGRLQPEGAGKAAAIVLAILNLAKGLGLSVVAEGVETEYQAEFLREAACPIFQGYLYSKPLPPEAGEAYIQASRLVEPGSPV